MAGLTAKIRSMVSADGMSDFIAGAERRMVIGSVRRLEVTGKDRRRAKTNTGILRYAQDDVAWREMHRSSCVQDDDFFVGSTRGRGPGVCGLVGLVRRFCIWCAPIRGG